MPFPLSSKSPQAQVLYFDQRFPQNSPESARGHEGWLGPLPLGINEPIVRSFLLGCISLILLYSALCKLLGALFTVGMICRFVGQCGRMV
jgi:hypothetical protein